MLLALFKEHPRHRRDQSYSRIIEVPAKEYYGEGYQDILSRKPNIDRARQLLGWEPKVGLHEALQRTLDAFLEAGEDGDRGSVPARN